MTMQLNIKARRRELGMTQEQVASALGVTAPAVSKWEQGATCPDVTLLPALARLLKTDVNALFAFDPNPSAQEIGRMAEEIAQTARRESADAAFDAARALAREYPDCGDLLGTLACVLDGSLMMGGKPAQEREKYERTIQAWHIAALNAEHEEIRGRAAHMLAGRYLAAGELERAREMIDRLPERSGQERLPMEVNLLMAQGRAEEAAKLIQRRLLGDALEIQMLLTRLMDIELEAGEQGRAEHIAGAASALTRQLDLWTYNACVPALEMAVYRRDVRGSVEAIRGLLSAMQEPWRMEDSPLYDRLPTREGADGKWMLPGVLAEFENAPQYDFLRADDEFAALIADYKARIAGD